jgi:putative transposase
LDRLAPDGQLPSLYRLKDLLILVTDKVKTVPYTPLSHPFVERLIGSIRRKFLDQPLFWNASDLEQKRADFRQYYDYQRAHTALDGNTPSEISGETTSHRANISEFQWESHCHGLYQLPVAA